MTQISAQESGQSSTQHLVLKPLTAQQKSFVEHLLLDPTRNAKQAALKAGVSQQSADSLPYQWLRLPQVIAELDRHTEIIAAQIGLTNERILGELANIAFFDIRDLFDGLGNLLPISAWPEKAARAVQSTETSFDLRNLTTQTDKVKVNDKLKALEMLMKFKKLYADRIEHIPGGELATLLNQMNTTRGQGALVPAQHNALPGDRDDD